MRYCAILGAVSRKFLSYPAILQFFKTKWFSFFTSLVNFDVLNVVFYCFSVQFCRFQSPLPPPLTSHYIMADTGAFINVVNQQHYETREHCNYDSDLLIEEPTERSQKVKKNIGVRQRITPVFKPSMCCVAPC